MTAEVLPHGLPRPGSGVGLRPGAGAAGQVLRGLRLGRPERVGERAASIASAVGPILVTHWCQASAACKSPAPAPASPWRNPCSSRSTSDGIAVPSWANWLTPSDRAGATSSCCRVPFDFMPPAIAANAISDGADPEHPVTVFQRLSLPDEQRWDGTLAQCAELPDEFSDLSIMVFPRPAGDHD